MGQIDSGRTMEKRAYIVIGPEGSGTRMMTQALIDGGCWGDAGHQQDLDIISFSEYGHLSEMIVFRRSLPHARWWPDLQLYIEAFENSGYNVFVIAMNREDDYMIASQLARQHITAERQGRLNIAVARTVISRLTRCLKIGYEAVIEPGVLAGFISSIGLDGDKVTQPYDGNAKYEEEE